MKWIKNNWGKILAVLAMLVGAADVTAGVRQGKSLMNVTNMPGALAASASAAFLGFQWINRRTVQARTARAGIDEDTLEHIENIFGVAAHHDVTPAMVDDLAAMAAEAVRRHAGRAEKVRLEGAVKVLPISNGVTPELLTEIRKLAEVKA